MKIDLNSVDFSDISCASVDLAALETEDDFRAEARRLLPTALTKVGEAVAEQTWEELQKNLSKSGAKAKFSASEKRQFIKETGRNYQRSASSRDKQEVEDHIVEQLRIFQKKAI
ncbi:MAG: hypothetical protein IGS39_19800 [Calothrix sp. C42_A2020_038]|nr:hypothetical protein [Calothrix sp. C42_A2020_038]